jgi:hypothetical protein
MRNEYEYNLEQYTRCVRNYQRVLCYYREDLKLARRCRSDKFRHSFYMSNARNWRESSFTWLNLISSFKESLDKVAYYEGATYAA